jgi:hypothetical protein
MEYLSNSQKETREIKNTKKTSIYCHGARVQKTPPATEELLSSSATPEMLSSSQQLRKCSGNAQ